MSEVWAPRLDRVLGVKPENVRQFLHSKSYFDIISWYTAYTVADTDMW